MKGESHGTAHRQIRLHVCGQHDFTSGHGCAICRKATTSILAYISVVAIERCRRTPAISCSDAPCRSIELATECRSTWAAPRLGQVTPARRIAWITTIEMAQWLARARKGARDRMNKAAESVCGRPSLI